jgi:galactan endo-1,6-beta-galactosidase
MDANERAMMAKAKSNSATRFELFSNSSMWWMFYKHNPSGAGEGSDNLQPWNYNTHAAYLATIALQAKHSWGIMFSSVEAFNEPTGGWWKGITGTQEGRHFDVSTQEAVITQLRSELNNSGLSGIAISASDENIYDEAYDTWNDFNSSVKVNVGHEMGSIALRVVRGRQSGIVSMGRIMQ